MIKMEIGMKGEMGMADKMTLSVLRSGRAVNCTQSFIKSTYFQSIVARSKVLQWK